MLWMICALIKKQKRFNATKYIESDMKRRWWHSCIYVFCKIISRMKSKIKFVRGFVCLILIVCWRRFCVIYHNLLHSLVEAWSLLDCLTVCFLFMNSKKYCSVVYAFDEFMIHSNSERVVEIYQTVYEADERGNDEHGGKFSRGALCVLPSLINYWELFSSGISHSSQRVSNVKFLLLIFPSFSCEII